jgi:septal ring factor EnvC (AmiA/AmiB activator)
MRLQHWPGGRGRTRAAGRIVAVVAVLLGAPASPVFADGGQTSQQVAQQIVQVQNQADALAKTWTDTQTEAADLADELASAKQELDAQTALAAELDGDLTKTALDRFTGAAGASVIGILADPTDRLETDTYRSVVTEVGATDLDHVEAVRTKLRADQRRVEKLQGRNDALARQTKDAQNAAEAKIAELTKLRDRLKDAEIRRFYEAIIAKQKAEEEARIAAEAAAAAKAQAEAAARAQTTSTPAAIVVRSAAVFAPAGAFTCPVQGAVFGDTWGATRPGGRHHEGVDMMAAYGTPIVAVVAGLANFHHDPLGGNAIGLDGDNGDHYYYAHLSSYAGTSRHVDAGEVIGFVGHTGDTTANHLHFEIHPGGRAAVDPYPTVRQYC